MIHVSRQQIFNVFMLIAPAQGRGSGKSAAGYRLSP